MAIKDLKRFGMLGNGSVEITLSINKSVESLTLLLKKHIHVYSTDFISCKSSAGFGKALGQILLWWEWSMAFKH